MSTLQRQAAEHSTPWPRRKILAFLAAGGTATVFHRALVSIAEGKGKIDAATLRSAEWIAGIELTDDKRKLMVDGVNRLLDHYETIRKVPLDNSVAPALVFKTGRDAGPRGTRRGSARPIAGAAKPLPKTEAGIAFASIADQGRWLRQGRLTSVGLTRLYLERLRRFDPELQCVITLLERRAMESAERADRELKSGKDRGPLHGIPWGAKDLLAVSAAPTTWGAEPFRKQILEGDAAVVRHLDEAGAVLLAKLSLGALAWGDVWFGGTTKNPWKPEQGSSGSSAGPAAATSAGLTSFAIGSETWGSIVSPCTRCGVTGFRPTFGRVSREGAMALSWSMDKLGPIARTVEDCALIFDAIHGADGSDLATVDRPFAWPPEANPRLLKVGYVEALFEEDRTQGIEDAAVRAQVAESQAHDRRTLQELRDAGLQLMPIALPGDIPVSALSFILTAEAAAAFDEITRDGRDDTLVRQIENAWPNVFRQGQTIPAVEYIRANRIRSQLIRNLNRALSELDAYVVPSFGGDHLLMTNLTGHPAVVAPNGFRSDDGTPTSITFGGKLHGDEELLSVAHAWQSKTGYHLKRPPVGGATE